MTVPDFRSLVEEKHYEDEISDFILKFYNKYKGKPLEIIARLQTREGPEYGPGSMLVNYRAAKSVVMGNVKSVGINTYVEPWEMVVGIELQMEDKSIWGDDPRHTANVGDIIEATKNPLKLQYKRMVDKWFEYMNDEDHPEDPFETFRGLVESGEVAMLWYDPRMGRIKDTGKDHENMVWDDPTWFNLTKEEVNDGAMLNGYFTPGKVMALRNGFVRVDIFKDHIAIEINMMRPGKRLKDDLSRLASRLRDRGIPGHRSIVVSSERGHGREFSGTLEDLWSTRIFESVRSYYSDRYQRLIDAFMKKYKGVALETVGGDLPGISKENALPEFWDDLVTPLRYDDTVIIYKSSYWGGEASTGSLRMVMRTKNIFQKPMLDLYKRDIKANRGGKYKEEPFESLNENESVAKYEFDEFSENFIRRYKGKTVKLTNNIYGGARWSDVVRSSSTGQSAIVKFKKGSKIVIVGRSDYDIDDCVSVGIRGENDTDIFHITAWELSETFNNPFWKKLQSLAIEFAEEEDGMSGNEEPFESLNERLEWEAWLKTLSDAFKRMIGHKFVLKTKLRARIFPSDSLAIDGEVTLIKRIGSTAVVVSSDKYPGLQFAMDQNDFLKHAVPAKGTPGQASSKWFLMRRNLADHPVHFGGTDYPEEPFESFRGLLESSLRFSDECRGYHHGQTDCTLYAMEGDEQVGYVDYSLFGDGLYLDMIRVEPKHQRKGIAKKMYQYLKSEHPNHTVHWGYTTSEGAALKKSVGEANEGFKDDLKHAASGMHSALYIGGLSGAMASGIAHFGSKWWNELRDRKRKQKKNRRSVKKSKRRKESFSSIVREDYEPIGPFAEILLEFDAGKTWDIFGDKIKARKDQDTSQPGRKDTLFRDLKQADPTRNQEYSRWIMQTYANGGINRWEDMARVRTALETYHKAKTSKKLEPNQRNIFDIKTLNDLEDITDKFSDFQSGKEKKKSELEIAKEESDFIYKDSKVTVWSPKTYKAMCFWGQKSKWCTTSGESTFKNYSKRGPLLVFLPSNPKHDGEKYMAHTSTKQFKDEKDRSISITNVAKSVGTEAIKSILGIDVEVALRLAKIFVVSDYYLMSGNYKKLAPEDIDVLIKFTEKSGHRFSPQETLPKIDPEALKLFNGGNKFDGKKVIKIFRGFWPFESSTVPYIEKFPELFTEKFVSWWDEHRFITAFVDTDYPTKKSLPKIAEIYRSFKCSKDYCTFVHDGEQMRVEMS